MWWYGRGNSGGSWLLEDKKANMWHGRGNSCGSWPPAFPRSSGQLTMKLRNKTIISSVSRPVNDKSKKSFSNIIFLSLAYLRYEKLSET